jgi:hypothetical protein
MPIYRVVSDPGHVVYVFDAADDDDAEMFARRLACHSLAGDPRALAGCLRVENQAGNHWRGVAAWKPGQ